MGANTDWPFKAPKNTAAITTTQIMHNGHIVLVVVHDENDEWQFLDGYEVRTENAIVVSLGSIVRRDNSLVSLADLGAGWQAWRDDACSPWERGKIS